MEKEIKKWTAIFRERHPKKRINETTGDSKGCQANPSAEFALIRASRFPGTEHL
jgi:hypothetical protein